MSLISVVAMKIYTGICLIMMMFTLNFKLWSQPEKVACLAGGRQVFSQFRSVTERWPTVHSLFLGHCSVASEALAQS